MGMNLVMGINRGKIYQGTGFSHPLARSASRRAGLRRKEESFKSTLRHDFAALDSLGARVISRKTLKSCPDTCFVGSKRVDESFEASQVAQTLTKLLLKVRKPLRCSFPEHLSESIFNAFIWIKNPEPF